MTCRWPGCTIRPAVNSSWGCAGHWRMLPKALRNAIVWKTPGAREQADEWVSEYVTAQAQARHQVPA